MLRQAADFLLHLTTRTRSVGRIARFSAPCRSPPNRQWCVVKNAAEASADSCGRGNGKRTTVSQEITKACEQSQAFTSARATGIEPATTGSTVREEVAFSSGNTPLPEISSHTPTTATDPELTVVIKSWERLPLATRQAILAIVNATR